MGGLCAAAAASAATVAGSVRTPPGALCCSPCNCPQSHAVASSTVFMKLGNEQSGLNAVRMPDDSM